MRSRCSLLRALFFYCLLFFRWISHDFLATLYAPSTFWEKERDRERDAGVVVVLHCTRRTDGSLSDRILFDMRLYWKKGMYIYFVIKINILKQSLQRTGFENPPLIIKITGNSISEDPILDFTHHQALAVCTGIIHSLFSNCQDTHSGATRNSPITLALRSGKLH